jgi:hypothetical protein
MASLDDVLVRLHRVCRRTRDLALGDVGTRERFRESEIRATLTRVVGRTRQASVAEAVQRVRHLGGRLSRWYRLPGAFFADFANVAPLLAFFGGGGLVTRPGPGRRDVGRVCGDVRLLGAFGCSAALVLAVLAAKPTENRCEDVPKV